LEHRVKSATRKIVQKEKRDPEKMEDYSNSSSISQPVSEVDPSQPVSEVDPSLILSNLLNIMGFQLDVTCVEEELKILLNIEGEESGVLIGKKGHILDALQYLLNKMVSRDNESHKPVVVDCGGYRQRRIDSLIQLAYRLSEKAIRTGKIIALNPMSAHDRRIMHMALKESPGVTTRSEGDGIYRRLFIVPEPDSSSLNPDR
jgi:spoIIIJ-associated protein